MYTDGTGKTIPSSCKRYTCTSVFEQYNVAGAGTVVTHSYPLRNEPSCAQKCNIIDGCGGYDYTTSGKFWSSCKLYGQDFNKIKRKTYGIKFWTFCSKSTQAKTTPAPAPAPAPSSMTSTETLNITQAPAIRPEKEEEERLVIIVLVSVFLVVVCLPVFICVACFKNYARTNTTVVRSVQLSNQAQSVSNVVIQPVQHGQMQMQQTQQSVQGRVIGVQPMQMQQMQMQQQMQPVQPMMAQAVPMQPNQQQQPGMFVVPAVPVPMYNNNNNF